MQEMHLHVALNTNDVHLPVYIYRSFSYICLSIHPSVHHALCIRCSMLQILEYMSKRIGI